MPQQFRSPPVAGSINNQRTESREHIPVHNSKET